MSHCSIIVVGCGLTGLTAALAMAQSGHSVMLLAQEQLTPVARDDRPISLTFSTVILLKQLQVWGDLRDIVPIVSVHVSEAGAYGSVLLEARDISEEALGYVLPYHLLERTLYEHVLQHTQVKRIVIQEVMHITESDQVQVSYSTPLGNEVVTADYVFAADGMHSRCRELLGIAVQETSHHDVAISGTLSFEHAQSNTAYERFTSQGVLALLPQAKQQFRFVATVDASIAYASTEAVQTLFADAFGARLGHILSFELQQRYPLKTQAALRQVTSRCVLLGDAAHRIYPLAAQGYNLTVRDIATLVDVLAHQQSLQTYVAWRKQDQRATWVATRAMELIFGLQIPLLSTLRGTALLLIDVLPMLRRQLIRRLCGRVGHQPRLLCDP